MKGCVLGVSVKVLFEIKETRCQLWFVISVKDDFVLTV